MDEEDDDDTDAAVGRWTALARFVSRRWYNARTMFDELGDVWRTEQKLTYKDLGDNLFQLDFYGEADYNFVIKGGTWHHRHDAVIVVPFGRDLCASEARPTAFPVWIRVYDLPRKLMTKKRGTALLEQFGEVMEVDTDDGVQASGPFLRVRVRWPIRQPLVYTVPVGKKDQIVRYNMRYERVPNFCFFCGRIGHARKECKLEVMPHSGCRYGTELRVSPFKKTDSRRFTVKGRKPVAARNLFPDEDESTGGKFRSSRRSTPAPSRTQSPSRRREADTASPEEEGSTPSVATPVKENVEEEKLADDIQDRLRVHVSPTKSAPTPPLSSARVVRVQEATANLKKTFEGVRQLRKQWEERAKAQTCPPPNPTPNVVVDDSAKETNPACEEPVKEPDAPMQPDKDTTEEGAAKPASETESQRFCQVTGLNYRVYKNRRGTVNQIRAREIDGKRGSAELRMNSTLGKRAMDYEMVYGPEEEPSFEVILNPKRLRTEEVSTGNNVHMSGPHGEARHEQ
jgi:hypothetical protein